MGPWSKNSIVLFLMGRGEGYSPLKSTEGEGNPIIIYNDWVCFLPPTESLLRQHILICSLLARAKRSKIGEKGAVVSS